MINQDICAMRSGVIETNTPTDTQSPTYDTGLDSFMDIYFLVLRGRLIALPYIPSEQTLKEQF